MESVEPYALLDLPEEVLTLVCVAASGVAMANASATCTKLYQLSRDKALWEAIAEREGLGGELLELTTTDGKVDHKALFIEALCCNHTRQITASKPTRNFRWHGGSPMIQLWNKPPSDDRLRTSTSCMRCGRTYDVELEAICDGTCEYSENEFSAVVTQAYFRCRATGAKWRECWYDGFC